MVLNAEEEVVLERRALTVLSLLSPFSGIVGAGGAGALLPDDCQLAC